MLHEAGVERVLADPMDWQNTCGFPERALDSGAYRCWKKETVLDVETFVDFAHSQAPVAEWITMPDVFGDAAATWRNWQKVRQFQFFVPVWAWDSDIEYLYRYLDERMVVGIGGLVPPMRAKDQGVLSSLTRICEEHPGRFHCFGLNWLKAIEELKSLLYSADTSKFLDGARYGHVIFRNTRTGHLSQAPASVLKLDLDRRQRCVESARAMKDYCEEVEHAERLQAAG